MRFPTGWSCRDATPMGAITGSDRDVSSIPALPSFHPSDRKLTSTMKTIIIGLAVTTILASASLPALATDHKPPPSPAPPTQLQGQAQGQVQGQAQGQVQGQGQIQKAYGGQGGQGGLGGQGGQGGKGGLGGQGGVGNGGAATGGNATGGSSNQSQDQSVNNNGVGSNSNNYQQSGIPVSSAVAPSFAIGGCQWAVSGGIQFFGTGVSGGGAGMYEFCKALMKAKHMQESGNRDVAKALECQDSSIRAAYKTAGQPCQEDMPRVAANGAAPVVPVVVGSTPQCFDARGNSVPVGQPGAVRCR